MKSSLHSLLPFLPFLLNHNAICQLPTANSADSLSSLLQLPTPEINWLKRQSHVATGGQSVSQRVVLRLKRPALSFLTPRQGPHRKHSTSIVACIRLRWNAFTQLFHSKGCTHHISYRDTWSTVAYGHCLATAVSLPPQFSLWAIRHNINQGLKTQVLLWISIRHTFRVLCQFFKMIVLWGHNNKVIFDFHVKYGAHCTKTKLTLTDSFSPVF
jgi:hypothetical protein